MLNRRFLSAAAAAVLAASGTAGAKPRIGESAIQVYAFPWGTRSLGMAETYTAVASGSEALFFNPAGLGQSPLAKTWVHSMNDGSSAAEFISVAAKPKRGIIDKEVIWALRENGEIVKFNGSSWISYQLHLIDSSETIREISDKYLDVKNFQDADSAQNQLMRFNNIGERAKNEIASLLKKQSKSSVNCDSLAAKIAYLPVSERNETDILGYLYENLEDSSMSDLSARILEILDKSNEFKEMLEVKVPFSIGLGKSATSLAVDASGRLWASTEGRGLWKFDGGWKQYTTADGLPSDTINSILSVDENTLIVSTSKGLSEYSNGIFKLLGGLSAPIKKSARKSDGSYCAVSDSAVYLIAGDKVTEMDRASIPFKGAVTALQVDSRDRLWFGTDGGVYIYDGQKWAQYQFKGSVVKGFAEVSPSHFWIASDKGAVEMIEKSGEAPEWKIYHGKKSLTSSVVNDVLQFGKDTWLATGNGISQYVSGQVQASAFFEKLLPKLHIDDIWHASAAGVIPVGEYGTIGVQGNYLYFGEILEQNPNGSDEQMVTAKGSFELLTGLSYGLSLKPDFSLGMSLKYVHSRLSEDAKANSIAVDAGLLKRNLFVKNLSLGYSLLNMGPAVSYDADNEKDPIPFTMRLGLAYTPVKTPSFELLTTVDLDREMVFIQNNKPMPFYKAVVYDLFKDPDESRTDEMMKILLHTGLEFTYAQLLSARIGYMHDEVGVRREITWGLGFKASVVMIDFGMILAQGDENIRDNQARFSITYAR